MEPMEDASAIERMLMGKAKAAGSPIYGVLELTPLCNMNCRMCYVRMEPAEQQRQGRLRTADEWLALARQMRDAGTLFVLLTGGEPLTHPGFREIYLGLRAMGMILTVNTNGTLIDEDWADFFAKNRPRRVNITLYGKDETAYRDLCRYAQGYERTVRAVRLLRARGVDVRLGVSAARANAGDVAQIIAQGEALGVPVRTDTYMMPAERERTQPYDRQARLAPEEAARVRVAALKREMAQEAGAELFAQYAAERVAAVEHFVPSDEPRRMTCYAGSCSFTVNWQGNLRPCVVMSGPSANAFEQGFLPAWQAVRAQCQTIRLNLKCSRCSLRPVCRTCPACALLETGSYDGIPDYMCRYAAESYRLLKQEADAVQI